MDSFYSAVNGVTTRYVHSGTQEIAEYSGSTLAARHVYGARRGLLMTIKGADKYYAITDPQGSVVALSDSARTVSNKATYSPWGESSNISGTASFGYTSQRYDGETGLYFYKSRYYSPKLGRFLSHDPIGYADNLNLYAYVNNDPLNYVDPTGMAAEWVAGQAEEKWNMFVENTDVYAGGSLGYAVGTGAGVSVEAGLSEGEITVGTELIKGAYEDTSAYVGVSYTSGDMDGFYQGAFGCFEVCVSAKWDYAGSYSVDASMHIGVTIGGGIISGYSTNLGNVVDYWDR